jgi:hypothetical protein
MNNFTLRTIYRRPDRIYILEFGSVQREGCSNSFIMVIVLENEKETKSQSTFPIRRISCCAGAIVVDRASVRLNRRNPSLGAVFGYGRGRNLTDI